jgi:hypothetical protein
MAINVNTVYKTVLLILNKEERGSVTPDEFNKISAQVQLEIFEQYSDDLNQQLRVPQSDTDYADRISNIDERLAIFKTFGTAAYDNATIPTNPYFTLPTTDIYGDTVEFYRLGSVVHKDSTELQRLQRMEFYNIQKSPLTKSTESFPTYLFENQKLFVKPDGIISDVGVSFLRKPLNPRWGYSIGSVKQAIYDSTVYGATLINTGVGTLTTSISTNPTNKNAATSTGVEQGSTSGSGTGLTVTITTLGVDGSANVTGVAVTSAGTGYVSGNTITFSGASFGGGVGDDLVITLTNANFNANSTYGSTQIELDVSEQTEVILRTLFYFGVVIKDPQIIQVAASQVQKNEINEKR